MGLARLRLDRATGPRKNRAVSRIPEAPPLGAHSTTLHYRVPFYDTDGMGVIHHANFARYLELARIQFLDEHDVPYKDYVDRGLHFAVTELVVIFKRAASFDDGLAITCWIESVRGGIPADRLRDPQGCGADRNRGHEPRHGDRCRATGTHPPRAAPASPEPARQGLALIFRLQPAACARASSQLALWASIRR